MRNYKIDSRYIFYAKTLSDGIQDKYFRNNYYYKKNKVGNEGLTEYLVSVLLRCTTLSSNDYVVYEYCKINNILGCRCKSFLNNNEYFITASRLYELLTGGNNLSDKLSFFSDARERLYYLINLYKMAGINEIDSLNYFRKIFLLDYIILNTDRHMRNIGIIYDSCKNSYDIAPIFDNGNSLNTDRRGITTSCTISGSFELQLASTGYPIVPIFKIKRNKLKKLLSDIPTSFEKNFLCDRLNLLDDSFYI